MRGSPGPASRFYSFPTFAFAMLVFAQTYRIRPAEVDVRDHLTLPSFLDLFQDLAGIHAEMLGFGMEGMLGRGVAWVLNRMAFEVNELPRTGQNIRIETWPSGADRLYAWRDAIAYNDQAEVVARGTTRWLTIDVEKRRPLRIDESLTGFVPDDRPSALTIETRRAAVVEPFSSHVVIVRHADLDVNAHANNVHYARWFAEAFDDAFLETHRQVALDLTVRAETFRGDVLRSDVARVAGDVFQHRLVRERDGREVANGWSRWATLESDVSAAAEAATRETDRGPEGPDHR